jgi:hypothetical protein
VFTGQQGTAGKKEDTTMSQEVFEGATVNIYGYTFTVSDLSWHDHNGTPCARFTGTCTKDARNDDIRGGGFDKSRYGGTNYTARAAG